MKISEMTDEQLHGKIAEKTGMSVDYVGSWYNKADELGLDNLEATKLLGTAMSIQGTDLDSFIYSGDMEMYVSMSS